VLTDQKIGASEPPLVQSVFMKLFKKKKRCLGACRKVEVGTLFVVHACDPAQAASMYDVSWQPVNPDHSMSSSGVSQSALQCSITYTRSQPLLPWFVEYRAGLNS
jgi:hypothetical protein